MLRSLSDTSLPVISAVLRVMAAIGHDVGWFLVHEGHLLPNTRIAMLLEPDFKGPFKKQIYDI